MKEQGFGLIELMIATLIFAGSALVIFGMQSRNIKLTHDVIQRSQAVLLASSATELMQINSQGVGAGYYQRLSAEASSNLASFCVETPKQCISASCNSQEMAAFDMYDLMCHQAQKMIDPKINISCSSTPCNQADIVLVKISWESRAVVESASASRQKVEFDFIRN
ncbi:MAG: type IV pilus modification PilV family protein [Endozoicomonas sp.]